MPEKTEITERAPVVTVFADTRTRIRTMAAAANVSVPLWLAEVVGKEWERFTAALAADDSESAQNERQ